jgi:hypothetical protein
MLTSNWSNRMAHMDVQLLLLYLSPLFLAFIGWEMLYLRKHGAAYPTAGYQWKDLFANATLALMHQGAMPWQPSPSPISMTPSGAGGCSISI